MVLTGKDKGKQGKIIQVLPKRYRVVVEGLNEVKRHSKPDQKNRQGGITTKSLPIHVSNLMRMNPKTDKPVRSRDEKEATPKTKKASTAAKKKPRATKKS